MSPPEHSEKTLMFKIFTLPFSIAIFIALPVSIAHAHTPNGGDEEISKLEGTLSINSGENCLSSLPAARNLLQEKPNHLLALKTIAHCTQKQVNTDKYAIQAKEIFEDSRILSIVPKLLQMAQIKELVPIMKEVELKEEKSLADYLLLNELYDRLDEPQKQIRALESALNLDPQDPRPLLLLGSKLLDQGQRNSAQAIFKTYLENSTPHPGRAYLWTYVAAMAYPAPIASSLVMLIWGLGLLIRRQRELRWKAIHGVNASRQLKLLTPILLLTLPVILAIRFWDTGQALPFGILLLIIATEAFILANPYLQKIYVPLLNALASLISTLFNGTRMAQILSQISTGWRLLIALTALFVLGTIVPTVEITDLRYGLTALCTLFFYATVGSLIVTFLRTSKSLQVSMRWIGVAATLPFLMSYVVSNWNDLGAPLMFARLPSIQAISNLINYLVFWGVSLALALHLSKILANALIKPVKEIMKSVAEIEKGNFSSKVEVMSNDEIGMLADSVNRMGDGLAKREQVERTFRRYIDHQVADRILEDPDSDSMISGKTMPAVVLFADIRGFTNISESATPTQVVEMLNEFFDRMVHFIRDNGGVVDKFIGDNLMAVWGVPKTIDQPEVRAIQSALAMLKATEEWNLELANAGKKPIGLGIGINTGSVVAGSIGCHDRMEYTVIGDVVNTAQRAESIAKPQQLLITDAAYQRVSHLVQATMQTPVKVKGKAQPQTFWHVHSINLDAAKSA